MPAARRSARASAAAAGPSSALAAAQQHDVASASGSSVVFVETRPSGSRARPKKQPDAAPVKHEPLEDDDASLPSARALRAGKTKEQAIRTAVSDDSSVVAEVKRARGKAKAQPRKTAASDDSSVVADVKPARARAKGKQAVKPEPAASDVDDGSSAVPAEKLPGGKVKKGKVEAEPRVVPARVQGSTHFVGAHVSMAGGIESSIENAKSIGANGERVAIKLRFGTSHADTPSRSICALCAVSPVVPSSSARER
jgi:hypothetical protein